jgi:hypothetical protein
MESTAMMAKISNEIWIAVEGGVGRELRATEENVVRAIRFGKEPRKVSAEKEKPERPIVFAPDRMSV